MSCLLACRLCLSDDVGLFDINNTPYQEMFEKLTNLSMVVDGKPLLACFLCKAQLIKSHKLREMCVRADSVLNLMASQFGLNNNALKRLNLSSYNLLPGMLSLHLKTMMEHVSTENELNSGDVVFVKQEEFSYDDETEITSLEIIEDVIDDKPSLTDLKPKLSFYEQSEEDDDMPLNILSCKEEKSERDRNVELAHGKLKLKIPTKRKKGVKHSERQGAVKKKKIKADKRHELIPTSICDYAREVTLSQEEQLKELNDRLTSSNYKISIYKCEFCYRGYSDGRAYDNHMLSHDEKSGKYECDICKFRYRKEWLLKAHVNRVHVRRYLCNLCPYRSQTLHKAKTHYLEHKGYLYPCDKCDKKFKKLTNYHQHLRGKHSTEFVCTRCGDCLASARGLKVHLHVAHRLQTDENASEPKEKRLCAECDIQFASVSAWQRHVLTSKKHKERTEKHCVCPICKVSLSENDLRAHISGHNREIQKVTCKECNKEFWKVQNLLSHMRHVHRKEPYRKKKKDLEMVSQENGSGLSSDVSCKSKCFVCDICGNKYSSVYSFRKHALLHSGVKAFACAAGGCGAAFAQRAQLQMHARVHSGERPYACALCPYRAARPMSLHTHQRVHTGEKPYGCDICGNRFTQSGSLKLHVRTVHMKLPSKYKKKPKLKCNEDKLI